MIRLLRLLRGDKNEDLHCSFEVVSLAKGATRPPYEALSYCWGTDDPSKKIKIFDNKFTKDRRSLKEALKEVKFLGFNIRHSLHEALKHFRTSEQDVILWVDALCIDQDNETEKTQQVAKMARIYSSAYHVLVWLGTGLKSCERAMDFVNEVIQLSKLDLMVKNGSHLLKWDELVDLLRCQWFSRRWVVQELAFAQDATLHYAEKSVYWSEFADAVALFVNKIDEIKPWFRKSNDFNNNQEHLGDVMALGASILVDVTRNSFRKRKWDSEDRYLEPLSGLEALISNLLSFEASDPRDTVYALLSIVRDNNEGRDNIDGRYIKADYQKTAIEVYRDFTRFCVERSKSVDIICRHWAPAKKRPLESARLNRTKSQKNGLIAKIPSWVPTLTGSPFGDPEAALNGRLNGDSFVGHPDRKPYNASKSEPASVRFEDYPILDASGRWYLPNIAIARLDAVT